MPIAIAGARAAESLADELYFVPLHHLPKVVSLIVQNGACLNLVHSAALLVEHAVTVAWAHRPATLRRLHLGQYRDTALHFHYGELFCEALRLYGDLRHADYLAAHAETLIAQNRQLSR